MLNRIFGDLLVSKGLISSQDVNTILASKKGVLAKPETICIVTKVLTRKQVDEILQKSNASGVEFKTVAVEDGYLTDDRLEEVLTYQKNIFIIFMDLLIERNIIDFDNIHPFLSEIQQKRKWTDQQLMSMLQWDTPAIVDIFVPLRSQELKALTVCLVNNLKRFVDADVYLDKASVTASYQIKRYASQEMLGDFRYVLYLEGEEDNLLGISNYYSGMKFEHVDDDALDNVSEFINCVNGQFASDMSYQDIDIDMAAPLYSLDGTQLSNGRIYIIPIHANGYDFKAIYEMRE